MSLEEITIDAQSLRRASVFQPISGINPSGNSQILATGPNGELIISQMSGLLNSLTARGLGGPNVPALSGGITVNGVTFLDGQRILLINQTTPLQNGLWVVSTTDAWTRPAFWYNGADVAGSVVLIQEGAYSGSAWVLKGVGQIIVGVSSQIWITAPVAASSDPRLASITFPSPNSGLDPTGLSQSSVAIGNAAEQGGEMHLPKGAYWIEGISVDQPFSLAGEGGGYIVNASGHSGTGTVLFSKSATGTMLSVSSQGFRARDVAFVDRSTGRQTAGGALSLANATDGFLDRVVFWGFYNPFHILSGFEYGITNCRFYDPVEACIIENLTNPDDGDQAISGNVWTYRSQAGSASAALIVRSGGGLKILGNKVNGTTTGKFQKFLWLHMRGGTSDLIATANSIENISDYAFVVDNDSAGYFNNVQIAVNEIGYAAGAVFLNGTGKLSSIIGNHCVSLSDASFKIATSNVTVGLNTHYDCPKLIRLQAATTGEIPTGVRCQEQVCYGDAIYLSSGSGIYAQADNRFYKPVYNATTGATTNQVLGRVALDTYQAGVLEFKYTGSVFSAGSAVISQKRTLTREGSGITIATIGADISSGAGAGSITITYDTTTVGTVLVKITTTTGAPTGSYSLSFDGQPLAFASGTT